jgi:hypothetical protein
MHFLLTIRRILPKLSRAYGTKSPAQKSKLVVCNGGLIRFLSLNHSVVKGFIFVSLLIDNFLVDVPRFRSPEHGEQHDTIV